jgi:hypothetical protein
MTAPQPAHPETARTIIEFLLMLVQSNENKLGLLVRSASCPEASSDNRKAGGEIIDGL